MAMIKKELAPGIVIYENILINSSEIINELELKVSDKMLNWKQTSVKADNKISVDPKYRDTNFIFVNYLKSIKESPQTPADFAKATLSEHFYNAFTECELDYGYNYRFMQSEHDGYSILKYSEGQQFKDHIDDAAALHRRVSTVFYMNDDYTGGEIEFPRFGLKIKPQKHQLLIFPSTYVYNHIVHPVLSGTRYAVVSWIK